MQRTTPINDIRILILRALARVGASEGQRHPVTAIGGSAGGMTLTRVPPSRPRTGAGSERRTGVLREIIRALHAKFKASIARFSGRELKNFPEIAMGFSTGCALLQGVRRGDP